MDYTSYENGSKNRKGTFKEKYITNRVVRSNVVPKAGERCHVHLLDIYLGKLPQDAHRVEAFTYFQPLPKPPKKAHGTHQYLLERTNWLPW